MKQHGSRAALCAGLCVLLLGGCAQPVEYETVRPDRGPVEYRVEDTGTAAYGDNYTVVPTVSGRVTQCTIQEGDAVEEGQVLYVIDSGDLEDQITQARLSLRSAETAVEQSAAACEDLVVHSCATGTVMAVNVHVGDFVSAGTPIAQVVDSAHLTLTVPFIPADAAALVPGSLATITFPALAESVTGSVVRVYDSPTVFAGGREGVYVEFSLDNPGALASGGTAMAAVGALTCMEAGQLSNATEQAIYATQSGQVLTLPIQAGTAVVEGQEVMTIKNDSLTNAAQNAVLSRDSAAVSLSQLESKRPDYTVRSPAAGIVLTRSVKEGDLAAAGSPMAVLAQPEELCVQVDIDELYIDRVWVEQPAEVSFTTEEGKTQTYAASVKRIDDTGISAGGVTEYPVELTLESREGLRAGMNVSVSLLVEMRENCLRLPSHVITGETVQVLREGEPVEVAIKTGLTGGGYTEILEGLTEEDEVILP